jgi:biofilm PGA synthesis N-glycosyltransferase PgaC
MLRASIGIMAYNEARNIGRLLEALASQRLSDVSVVRIVVVSSGSTDGTNQIVAEWAKRDGRIQLVRQAMREGKSAAINVFLEKAEGDVFVLESGDTVPAPDCVERLVAPFADPGVGMTGARPVPVDDPARFMGFVVHMLWRLHHEMALATPKLGEMVAFRSFVRSIPPESAVDEASIEAIVTAAGKKLRYVPEAVVYNKGASSVRDFLKQRRRIYAGHLWLSEFQDYDVATRHVGGIVTVLMRDLDRRPRALLWTAGGVFLEFLGRALGTFDFLVLKRNPHTWDVAESTKSLGPASAESAGERRR